MLRVYANGDILGVLQQRYLINMVFKWSILANGMFLVSKSFLGDIEYPRFHTGVGSKNIEHKIVVEPLHALQFLRELHRIYEHSGSANLRFESQKFTDILLKGEPNVYI